MSTQIEENKNPLVSIVVLAYNHLDYTKQCIDSLYRYTSHIDFELILINNGSSDGTEAYFCSLPNAIKISFPHNIGVDKAINYGFRMAGGKYTLNLSNDIVVTSNWLDNLIQCAQSDERIGMVVPVCGASSNNQQVDLGYHSLEEMQRLAKDYNISNPNLWEERVKLVTYTCLFRTEVQKAMGGFDEEFNPGAYDDDAISFRIRRSGYHLMLAKDTYVHHFGSVTFNAEYSKNNLAQRNLNLFYSKFGVHPWQASFIDFNAVNLFEYDGQDSRNILGIGKSCGSTLLQIKNMCRSKGGRNARIYYLSELDSNMLELRSVCETCIHASTNDLIRFFGNRFYDYIVVESESDKMENIQLFFKNLGSLVEEGGQLVCTAANNELFKLIQSSLEDTGLDFTDAQQNYYYCFKKTRCK
nr:glycosyltransferase [uncultured Caproiciproducens sp.]